MSQSVSPSAVRSNMIALITAGTVLGVVVVVALTVLSLYNKDATEIRELINTVFNLVSIVLAGGAVTYAKQAKDNAGVAAEQTNGMMDARLDAALERRFPSSADQTGAMQDARLDRALERRFPQSRG